MITTTKKIILGAALVGAITLGGIEAQVPAAEPTDNFIKDKTETATMFRKYLSDRLEYMTTNQARIGIPDASLQKAVYAKDQFDDYLLRKKFINSKTDTTLQDTPKGVIGPVIEGITSNQIVQRAYAYVFGKEDFESCGALPCTYDSATNWGASTQTLDTSSAVNGVKSEKCVITGETGCYLEKAFTATNEVYWQQSLKLATGYTFGPAGYSGLTQITNSAGTQIAWMNIEDYGVYRVTLNGTFGYTDTGINLNVNQKYKIEWRFKVSATVGDVDLWIDNNVAGSPTYNGSGTLNTGTVQAARVQHGTYYAPEDVGDTFYDDGIIDSSFIGSGAAVSTVPSNINGYTNVNGVVNIRN